MGVGYLIEISAPTPAFLIRKLRLREVKRPVRGHKAKSGSKFSSLDAGSVTYPQGPRPERQSSPRMAGEWWEAALECHIITPNIMF